MVNGHHTVCMYICRIVIGYMVYVYIDSMILYRLMYMVMAIYGVYIYIYGVYVVKMYDGILVCNGWYI